MHVIRKGQTNDERRGAWEPPTVTKVEIGKTKSAHPRAVSPDEPRPPSSPATKFGFSFEMAFPMSSRIENSN